MSKRTRVVLIGFLISALGAALGSPARAELSANDLNAELLKTRDEVKAPLAAWQAAVTEKTEKKFEEVKDKLAETWKEGRKDAVKAAVAKLAPRRQTITDLLAGDPERLDRVAKKLKEQFDERQKALEEAGDKFDADAEAFQVPTGSDAQKQAEAKLAELTTAALAPVSDAEWGKVFESVKVAFAEPTAAEKVEQAQAAADEKVKEAATSVQKFIDAVERDFARIVRCTYTATTGTLVCDGNLAVSAAEISTIEVSGLPHDKRVTVSARAAKDAPTEFQDGQIDPESDLIVLEPGEGDKVSIDVHLRRRYNPTYEDGYSHPPDSKPPETKDNRVIAAWSLREANGSQSDDSSSTEPPHAPRHLILIVSGRAPKITVQVKVGDGKAPGQLVTASPELGYARWGVDSGGFFAITALSDEQLKTEPGTSPNTVKIKRRGGGSDFSQDTGVFLNLVPKNYPIWGIGIGFSANKDQPNTFYLGPSLRLLSFRNRAVASFSLGTTMRSVKRFPGLNEGTDNVSATDPRLEGTNQLKFGPYAIVQLGFAFGRVPGAKDGN
jgi:hypothetical protein